MRTPLFLFSALALTSLAAGQPSMRTITEQYPDRFSLDITYPRFYDKYPVAEAASKAVGDWAAKQQNEFTTSAVSQVQKSGVPSGEYEAKITSEVSFYSPKKLISVMCDSYSFLGGAHGISAYKVFNYGDVKGKVKELTLADLFKKGSNYKSRVTGLILGKLKEDEDATKVQEGEVKSLTDKQLNRFKISPEGLTFLFDHYELAPYSNGRFEVELTTEELGPDFEWGKVLAE